MRPIPLVATAVCLSLAASACVIPNDDPHPVSRVLPTAEDVRIRLPESSSAKGTSELLGDLSPWYVVTRAVTRDLNGGTAWVLLLVHTIVQFPVTTVDGDRYTWGPWSGALDPAEYRLVVTALANGSYDWSLDGRSKTQPGTGFETVISGNAVPGPSEGTGRGDFAIDFDAAARVNPVDHQGRGLVAITYDLAARRLDMAIDTVEVRGGVEVPVFYAYAYDEAADGAGDMVFAIHGDTDDPGDAAEDAVIRSRWLATGAGRADLRLSGGDLEDLVITASECWSTSFRVVYYGDSLEWLPTEGSESDCAFATADLPPL
jgi:hypothetical protein